MKKTSIAIMLLLLTMINPTWAQDKKPKTSRLENSLAQIFGSMATFEVENKIYEMKKDGVTERTFSLFVNAKGKLFEVNDGNIIDGFYEGQEFGTDILPFNIRLSNDNRTFIEVGAFNVFKVLSLDHRARGDVDFIAFEYKKNYDYSNTSEMVLSLVRGSLSGIVVGHENSKFQLKANGGFGLRLPLNLQVESANPNFRIDTKGNSTINTGIMYKAGFLAEQNFKKDYKVSLGAQVHFTNDKFRHYVSEEASSRMGKEEAVYKTQVKDRIREQNNWDKEKFEWEVANGHGTPTSANYYTAASGASARPSDPGYISFSRDYYSQNLTRTKVSLNPSLAVGKEFKNKSGRTKSSLQLEVSANLFLVDQVKGKKRDRKQFAWQSRLEDNEVIDNNLLKNDNSKNTYNVKLIYTFGSRK